MVARLLLRFLMLAAVIGAVAAVYPALRRQRELQERALAAIENDREPAPAPAVEPPDEAAEGEEPAAARTYYSYIDAGGSLHFVDALERVPEPHRKSARPISMSGGPRQSEPPALARAETPAAKRRPFSSPAAQAPAARGRGASEVIVYTTSWCPWCRKTTAWLDERGIEYENRDIEKNPAWREELLDKSGGTSIPVVEIDGEVIRGFSPARMGELL
jgi:glutaredoxin-like YruB-family protein